MMNERDLKYLNEPTKKELIHVIKDIIIRMENEEKANIHIANQSELRHRFIGLKEMLKDYLNIK